MQIILNYFENNKDIEYVLMFVISKQKEKDHSRTIVQCKRGWDFTIIHILTYLLMLCIVTFELKIISKLQNFTLQDLYLTFHFSKLTLVFNQPFILGHCFLCLKNISKIVS
jgi:hypothetical protein